MRIASVGVSGIGGLPDSTVILPAGPLAAFAGANGTGKSKLLAALLAPWSRVLPSPVGDVSAEVRVELVLSEAERQAAYRLSNAARWGETEVPERFTAIVRHEPLVGIQHDAEPRLTVLMNMFSTPEFLQRQQSLNVIYLPAERRLVPSGQSGIDLNQLSDLIAWQKTTEPRSAVQNYGRLDDQEFEQFAKALCVANTLPNEADEADEETDSRATARVTWSEFVETVNALTAPKELLPLTRQHPEELRVRTPSGATHSVRDLSSGERQALIVISRVLRAGSGDNVVLIDEPDAYLHPQLSQRLMQALERGVGETGQLIVATHSPAILDSLSPSAIVRLGYDEPPRLVADEAERLDLYRRAGFRASALTQSDVLLITEGESDVALLTLRFPELSRAAARSAGARARVLREVEQLAPYELPVLGVVDRDVLAPAVPAAVSQLVTVWPTADLEGLFLSEDATIERMLELGLLKPEYRTVPSARQVLAAMASDLEENVVAEIAQRQLRRAAEREWPSPRGNDPLGRLRHFATGLSAVEASEIDQAIANARSLWEEHTGNRWVLVRGKYVLNAFTDRVTEMRSGRALLEAVARTGVELQGLQAFGEALAQKLE